MGYRALATALAVVIGLSACGEDDGEPQAEIEAALAAVIQKQRDANPRETNCIERSAGWDCEVELRDGTRITCGAGDDGEHPQFSCIE